MSDFSSAGTRGRGVHAFDVCELDLTIDTTAAAVRHVGHRAYAVEAGLIGFDGIPALQECSEEMRAQPLRWLGAITEGERVAAFVAWKMLAGEKIVDIDRVCVDPAWFRHGLASRLINHLLVDLAPVGDVYVSTGADNGPAVALYESLGFSRIGTIERAPGLHMAQFELKRD